MKYNIVKMRQGRRIGKGLVGILVAALLIPLAALAAEGPNFVRTNLFVAVPQVNADFTQVTLRSSA